MGYVHCCGRLIKARSFVLDCLPGYIDSKLYIVESCPHCDSFVLLIVRTNYLSKVEVIRKSNARARKLYDKIKSDIVCELKLPEVTTLATSKSYLNYSHFGSVKKCYSNLSTVKCGMFDPFDSLDIVEKINNKGFIAV